MVGLIVDASMSLMPLALIVALACLLTAAFAAGTRVFYLWSWNEFAVTKLAVHYGLQLVFHFLEATFPRKTIPEKLEYIHSRWNQMLEGIAQRRIQRYFGWII